MNEVALDIEKVGLIPTTSFVEASKAIKESVTNNGMLAVVGMPGMGKTTIKRITVGRYTESNLYHVIEMQVSEKRYTDLTGSIKSVMIDSLLRENPRRDSLARDNQLIRGLRSVSESKRVVLVIDEAQDLNFETIYGIKKIHELGGSLRNEFLFSVLLFGKPKLKDWLKPRELGWRIAVHDVNPMDDRELKAFVNSEGVEFDEKYYASFWNLTKGIPQGARFVLNGIKKLMKRKKIDANMALSHFISGDMTKDLKSRGLSYTDVARWIFRKYNKNFDKSTIGRAVKAESVTETSNEIRGFAAELISEVDQGKVVGL